MIFSVILVLRDDYVSDKWWFNGIDKMLIFCDSFKISKERWDWEVWNNDFDDSSVFSYELVEDFYDFDNILVCSIEFLKVVVVGVVLGVVVVVVYEVFGFFLEDK